MSDAENLPETPQLDAGTSAEAQVVESNVYKIVECEPDKDHATFPKEFKLKKFDAKGKEITDCPAAVNYITGSISGLSNNALRNATRFWARAVSDAEDTSEQLPTEVVLARDRCIDDFHKLAENFIQSGDEDLLLKKVAVRNGRFQEELRQIQQANSAVFVWRSLQSGADHITFQVKREKLSEAQRQVLVETEKAMKVIFVVFEDVPIITRRRLFKSQREYRRRQRTSRRNYYIRKLADVARNGLADPEYGVKAISGLTSEFLAREATSVKSQYVATLGWHSLVYGCLFLAVYGALWHYTDFTFLMRPHDIHYWQQVLLRGVGCHLRYAEQV